MNYIVHVPLAGGFALGNMNIIGKPPEAITSYTPFEANDLLLRRYLKKKGYDVPYYQLDKLSENEQRDLSHLYGRIDFATAVPPCSGLSQAAQRKAGSRATAPPNDWMYESARFLLGKVKPTVYSFENAPTLFTGAGDDVRRRLIEIGKEFGYAVTFYKTNTLYHGVPQFRPRTYGMFYKGEHAPILNSYRRCAPNQLEYLNQIPKEASLQNEYVCNEWDITKFEIFKYLNKLYGKDWRKVMNDYKPHLTTYDYLQRVNLLDDFQAWQKVQPDATEIVTKNIEHIKKKAALGKGARINYRVLEVDKDYTYAVIGEMMGKQVHPVEDRLLNMREHMHLMGLPFDYDLETQKEYVKITQNVPVKTCEDITTEIVNVINGNRRLSPNPVYMQDNSKETVINKSKQLF
jgi:site-specific DNA-cytosine methylase